MAADLATAVKLLKAEIKRERIKRIRLVSAIVAEVTKLNSEWFPDWSTYDAMNTKLKRMDGELEGKDIALTILNSLIAGTSGKKKKGKRKKVKKKQKKK